MVLDAALMEHAVINAHPLANTMTTSIARDDLVKFLESTGHPPRIVAVRGPPDRSPDPIAFVGSPAHLIEATQRWSGTARLTGRRARNA